MSKKLIFANIIFFVVSFGSGFFIGTKVDIPSSRDLKNNATINNANSFYQEGWNAAKKRLAESGFFITTENKEIKSLNGEILDIKDNKLSLKIRPTEPLADPALDIRTVIIDSNTKFYQLIQKDQAVFQKEIEEFVRGSNENWKKDTSSQNSIIMPDSFIKNEIKLLDIKKGQQILVTSDSNIKDAKEFKAVDISIQNMPMTAQPSIPLK